jgi:hypothetical protein
MADASLGQLWSAVLDDFARAQSLLPERSPESDGGMTRLAEWLAHNELELALDELELLGENNAVPPAFWEALASAAERMGLVGQQERITRRCT